MGKLRNTFEFPDTFKVKSLIKSPKQYNIEDLIKVIGNKIFKYDVANIIISHNNNLLDRLSTKDYKLFAFLDKTPIPNSYNLILRTTLESSLSSVLCHEMQHFDQYERGDLIININGDLTSFIWKGKEYSSNTSYNERPWEIEAMAAEHSLWKQFKNLYYK